MGRSVTGIGAARLEIWIALLGLLTWLPASAVAQGFEFTNPGTRAMGRGGAFMSRADDPMALGYNPAALAFLPGYQLDLGTHLSFYDACVDRTGGYNDGDGDGDFIVEDAFFESRFGFPDSTDPTNFASQSFPRVCRSGYPGPSPQLVFSGHPIPELGFAIGLLTPGAVGNGVWGNPDGSVDANGMNLPSPVRYAMVEQNLLLVNPSIGVGFSPAEWISIGATFQWGIATVDFVNHSTAGTGAEDPADDVRTQLKAEDWFIPAVIASVHVVPIDELDIVAMARFSDGIDANGSLTLTTGVFGTDMAGSLSPSTVVLPGATLHAGQPWQFGLSVRYSDRLHRRYRDPDEAGRVTGRIEDPMQNERFDLELDVVYQVNSQVTDFVITPPEGATVPVCDDPPGCAAPLNAPLPSRLAIPHAWKDQLAIRAGGDWNIIPGTLAIRGGANFNTSGVNSQYMTQDFMPLMQVGLSLGLTVRFDRFDISAAYSHVFQIDETVTNPQHRLIAASGTEGQCTGEPVYDGSQPIAGRGCYPQGYGARINGATYYGEYNVISLSMRYNFN